MRQKPEIFKPDIGNINNNKKTYYSFLEDRLDVDLESDRASVGENVIDFINKVSKSGSYIFNRDVVIVTKDDEFETRIAGKMGDKIVTLDNRSIAIDDIVKVYEKNSF